MISIKNHVKSRNTLCTGSYKIFRYCGGNHLKRISTHLYFIIYNEINISHYDIQKHVSYKNGTPE